jgi:hypothetical protein
MPEFIVSDNGLNYSFPLAPELGVPTPRQKTLVREAVEACTFDWRRIIRDDGTPHMPRFEFVQRIWPEVGFGGIGGVEGRTALAVPFEGNGDWEGEEDYGDLGVFSIYETSPTGSTQGWEEQRHVISILNYIDHAAGSEANPLGVGGELVFKDTVIRCLGMLVTFVGGPCNPYARQRLNRIFGYPDDPPYFDAENSAGHAAFWAQCGWPVDHGTDTTTGGASVAWYERITEGCAEAFKQAYTKREDRAWDNRHSLKPRLPLLPDKYFVLRDPWSAFMDIYEDEMGSYVWRDERTTGPNFTIGTDYYCENENAYTGELYSTLFGTHLKHVCSTLLPPDCPPPLLEVLPHDTNDQAKAKLKGTYDGTVRGPYFNGVKATGGNTEWKKNSLLLRADYSPFDTGGGAGDIVVALDGSAVSPVYCPPNGEEASKARDICFTAKTPFYSYPDALNPDLIRKSYCRSRVICSSRGDPVYRKRGRAIIENFEAGRRLRARAVTGKPMLVDTLLNPER